MIRGTLHLFGDSFPLLGHRTPGDDRERVEQLVQVICSICRFPTSLSSDIGDLHGLVLGGCRFVLKLWHCLPRRRMIPKRIFALHYRLEAIDYCERE